MTISIDVPFGDGIMPTTLPDDTFFVPYGGGKKSPVIDDMERAVTDALANPLGMAPIGELVSPASRVTVAFDDPTVPSYGAVRRVCIQHVIRALDAAGVARRNVRFICANALHRKFTHEELGLILGDDVVQEMAPTLQCHDAENAAELVHLGLTEDGYDVEISRHVVEADLTIYVNSAHYRGFAGGWKSVCVGLSTWRSIRHHHHPDGMSMSVEGNRMHAMLDQMGTVTESGIAGKIFKIDVVEASPFQSAAVFAGDTWQCRAAALELLKALYPPRRSISDTRYDVIVYGLPNWSPYAIFARVNPILTLVSSGLGYLGGTIQALGKPGCTVIMASPCPLDWDDTHHPSYRDVWENVLPVTRDPYEIERDYTEHYATHEEYIAQYRNGNAFHPVHGVLATHPLRRLKHCGQVIVAGAEDAQVPAQLGFLAAESVERALEMATELHGTGCSVAYAQHPAAPTKVNM